MIDYAYPAMMAERAMKELHLAALENDYDAAIAHGAAALAEVRLTITALKDMKERNDALRKQTETV